MIYFRRRWVHGIVILCRILAWLQVVMEWESIFEHQKYWNQASKTHKKKREWLKRSQRYRRDRQVSISRISLGGEMMRVCQPFFNCISWSAVCFGPKLREENWCGGSSRSVKHFPYFVPTYVKQWKHLESKYFVHDIPMGLFTIPSIRVCKSSPLFPRQFFVTCAFGWVLVTVYSWLYP